MVNLPVCTQVFAQKTTFDRFIRNPASHRSQPRAIGLFRPRAPRVDRVSGRGGRARDEKAERGGVGGTRGRCRQARKGLRPAQPNLLVQHAAGDFARARELAVAAGQHQAPSGGNVEPRVWVSRSSTSTKISSIRDWMIRVRSERRTRRRRVASSPIKRNFDHVAADIEYRREPSRRAILIRSAEAKGAESMRAISDVICAPPSGTVSTCTSASSRKTATEVQPPPKSISVTAERHFVRQSASTAHWHRAHRVGARPSDGRLDRKAQILQRRRSARPRHEPRRPAARKTCRGDRVCRATDRRIARWARPERFRSRLRGSGASPRARMRANACRSPVRRRSCFGARNDAFGLAALHGRMTSWMRWSANCSAAPTASR